MIEVDRIFLICKSHERQRQLGIAVIACGIEAMRDEIADHPVLHTFFKSLRQMLQDRLPELGDKWFLISRRFSYILLYGRCFRLHNERIMINSFSRDTKMRHLAGMRTHCWHLPY